MLMLDLQINLAPRLDVIMFFLKFLLIVIFFFFVLKKGLFVPNN